ncbi:MAG TPA: UDP-N-acetylmuramoyl-L-alanyl-D-glutamate--2,6-diaminopimelate ligase [Acidimicrobiia bacterium]|nr:UDP-N-acetylmuramoyl-L-alanyl-D-glutamate--2,6-diaminopimelate ligase [Acidimicrobiia bacterium]
MRLHELLDGGVGATPIPSIDVRGDRSVDVQSVVHDSRQVSRGALFCCIPGEHVDGHNFAADAVARGAVACLVERQVPVDVAQVQVRSVREAMGPIAARFHGAPSHAMQVLGVTGTNGKTTTTYLLEAIGRAAGDHTGVIGTTGARVGDDALHVPHTTPEATDLQALLALMRTARVRVVAMEVSSHALDQHRVDGTRFAAACFTNLSHDHLDYHGSIDAYFEAKARLFTPEFTRHAAVGVDDPKGLELEARARKARLEVRTFAVDREADVRARDVVLAADHSAFTIYDGSEPYPVRVGLVGRFNVENVLAAYTTARVAGFGGDVVARALEQPIVVPGRMERIDAHQPFTVLVDYAHTPDALESVLRAARPLAGDARVIVVFGAGGDRDRGKRPLMGAAVAQLADVAIVTSDNPRSETPAAIAAEVVAGMSTGASVTQELDRRAAIRMAVHAARAGDVIVIAGKGHETGQTAQGVTVPFDDRLVAREELEGLNA